MRAQEKCQRTNHKHHFHSNYFLASSVWLLGLVISMSCLIEHNFCWFDWIFRRCKTLYLNFRTCKSRKDKRLKAIWQLPIHMTAFRRTEISIIQKSLDTNEIWICVILIILHLSDTNPERCLWKELQGANHVLRKLQNECFTI